jgi:hypothetical protein
MGVLWSGKVPFGLITPIAKIGFPLPMPSHPNCYGKPDRGFFVQNVEKSAPGFSAIDLRHRFVVRALETPRILRRRPYIYICLQCKYAFLVNERRDSIVALDRKAQPIPEPENSRRLATFGDGPCPRLKAASKRIRREPVRLVKPKRRMSPSGILGLLATVCAKMRYPYFSEKNIHPLVGISPQDLLS